MKRLRKTRKTTSREVEIERPAASAKPRAAGLVHQARRAGRVVVGVKLSRDTVRRGKAAAILIAEDLSPNRAEGLVERWSRSGVPLYGGWTKDELGELAGKPAVAVLTITDRNIAAGLRNMINAPPTEREE